MLNFVNLLSNVEEIFVAFLGAAFGIVLVTLIIGLAIYIAVAIFLNKFHKLVYGYGNALAWIPFANTYLLGKLTVNEICGWVLLLFQILGTGIIFEDYSSLFNSLFGLASFILFIYAIFKYYRIKKEDAINNNSLDTPYDNMVNGEIQNKNQDLKK